MRKKIRTTAKIIGVVVLAVISVWGGRLMGNAVIQQVFMNKSSKITYYSSGVLFRTAITAFERIPQKENKLYSSDNNVLIVILFVASTLEAFINEFGEFASAANSKDIKDKTLIQLINILNELENAKESTRLKYQLAKFVLSEKTYSKGQPPYEDLDLLFKLRNNIVHLKPQKITDKPEKVIKMLISKKLLSENDTKIKMSWISIISKRTVARWAINTAIDIIQDIQNSVLDSSIKNEDARFLLSRRFKKFEKVK